MDARKLTKWTLLGLGTGAAAAYLTQSEFGQKKCAALARGAKQFLNKAAHEGKKSLVDSEHRLFGIAAELWTAFTTRETPSDRVLEERIRSRIGRVVSHPRKIHVICDHGVATLWGLVPENEVSLLMREVEITPGVAEVVDHLEIGKLNDLPAEPSNPLKHARDQVRLNWSPSKRLVVGATGAALATCGWQRKDTMGNALMVLGTGMVVRSAMQNHLRATLALTEGSPGFELEKTIRIKAPISDLFDFWANPENYPKAFSHVERIERLGENLYRWTLFGPAGIPISWEGVITRTVPNTLVEWKSLPGSAVGNFGIVHFDPVYDASTRICIRMFYRPPAGVLGRFFAELFGAGAEQILDQDLKQLKHVFENETFITDQRKARCEERELLKTATT